MADILHIMAVALRGNDQTDSAIICYEIAANYNRQYKKMELLDSTLAHANKSYRLATDLKTFHRIQKAGESLSKIHKALFHTISKSHLQLRIPFYKWKKISESYELQTKYETEKKEQAISILTKEKANTELRRNIFAIMAISIFIFGLLVFNSQMIRRKKDRQLLEKEHELDRMKSRFFTNISHEFRTPLTLY